MHRVIICYMHNEKYRMRYGQSVTCLIHSMKIFALTFQITLLVTFRAIYRKGKIRHKQSCHNKSKDQQSNTTRFSNKTSTKRLDTAPVSMCSKVTGGR